MTGPKTNERPGTRAVLRHYKMSAYKARQVLDVVRGKEVGLAEELLRTTPREAARVISKVLASAVANARNNDGLDPDDLYIAACYADEGTTLKRWRPRARGRATRIRKRTCHITVIVARLPEERLEHRRTRQALATVSRSRRVAASRRADEDVEETTESETSERPNRAARRARNKGHEGHDHDHDHDHEDEAEGSDASDEFAVEVDTVDDVATAEATDTGEAAADEAEVDEAGDGEEAPTAEADGDEAKSAAETAEAGNAGEKD